MTGVLPVRFLAGLKVIPSEPKGSGRSAKRSLASLGMTATLTPHPRFASIHRATEVNWNSWRSRRIRGIDRSLLRTSEVVHAISSPAAGRGTTSATGSAVRLASEGSKRMTPPHRSGS